MRKRIQKIGVLGLLLITILLPNKIAFANAEKTSWTPLASMSISREDFQTEVIDGKIYVIGGWSDGKTLSSTEVYSPSTDTWTTLASMSTSRCNFQTEVVGGKIYAIGGYTCRTPKSQKEVLSSTEVYDPVLNTWSTLSPMSTPHQFFQTEVVEGKIYAIGGSGLNGIGFSSTEVYNTNSNTWTTLSSMSIAREYLQTEVVDGKIYAIGGMNYDSGTTTLSSIEVYTPSTNSWTTLNSMTKSRCDFQSAVIEGNIYAIGGLHYDSDYDSDSNYDETILPSIEVYNPSTNSWITLANMSVSRNSPLTQVVDGKIYTIGGLDDDDEPLSSSEVYNTSTNSWASLDNMPTGVFYFQTEVINGKIYAISGSHMYSINTTQLIQSQQKFNLIYKLHIKKRLT